MRLIDADAVLVGIATFKGCYEMAGLKPWIVEHIQTALQMVERFVKETPTVDAAPVVQGRWDMATDGDGVVCSVCGTDFCILLNETDGFNYCPNCGAKMDGGEKNER